MTRKRRLLLFSLLALIAVLGVWRMKPSREVALRYLDGCNDSSLEYDRQWVFPVWGDGEWLEWRMRKEISSMGGSGTVDLCYRLDNRGAYTITMTMTRNGQSPATSTISETIPVAQADALLRQVRETKPEDCPTNIKFSTILNATTPARFAIIKFSQTLAWQLGGRCGTIEQPISSDYNFAKTPTPAPLMKVKALFSELNDGLYAGRPWPLPGMYCEPQNVVVADAAEWIEFGYGGEIGYVAVRLDARGTLRAGPKQFADTGHEKLPVVDSFPAEKTRAIFTMLRQLKLEECQGLYDVGPGSSLLSGNGYYTGRWIRWQLAGRRGEILLPSGNIGNGGAVNPSFTSEGPGDSRLQAVWQLLKPLLPEFPRR